MNYYYLNPQKEQLLFIKDKTDRDAVISNIITLRKSLSEHIPEKKLSGNLLLGTWNLREFGNTKYGGRMVESLYYIAEIISRFDLIAIQEVRDNLQDINSVCRILGSDWGIFTSVVTEGASGNKERLAFLYDKRTVSFRNIAGQVILPPSKNLTSQFARSPYIIRFQSGWLKFDICTAHIYYGKDVKTSAEYKRRVKEIEDIVGFFKKYYVDKGEANNIFILGDFNIENDQSPTYKAATSSAFSIPDAILKDKLPGSNVAQDKIYDQILYYNKYRDITFKKAGIYNFFDTVFDKLDGYEARIEKHYKKITPKVFRDFKTYQMSDHLPLWVEMNTDHTESYL
ncbi:MAG: endonuclease/exonuclease/phosphatase family protein, partial [Chitinophagaceae bacterium]